jgi:hypothetical protein
MSHNYIRAFGEGQRVAQKVGLYLNHEGVDCTVTELSIASDPSEWSQYTENDKDIVLANGDVIEVKEINQHFTSDPSSWPFREVIVDTYSGYTAKKVKPIAYIFVSRKTKAMLSMATDKPRGWKVVKKWDKYRRINEDFYFAPTSMLRPIDKLVEHLKKRLG